MNDFRRRGRNALLGLAVGDAIGWPAMFHRSHLLPPWTRRLRREIDAQREDAGVLRVPIPFSLNQPPEAFDLFPTDDTEWAAWTMQNLRQHRCRIEKGWVTDAWLALEKQQVRGGVSTQAALQNLRMGVMPPLSGRDNPHYFDDGAACRAVPIGVAYAGKPDQASDAAAVDASVTNFDDGLWTAGAVAAAVSVACAGGTRVSTIEAAVRVLPPDSWSRRVVEHALALAQQDLPLLALFPSLHEIFSVEYSDGCVGPETLALSLAIVSRVGEKFDEALTLAASFARTADAAPAIVGAIVGALAEGPPIPPQWEKPLQKLKGVALPFLAGTDYLLLVDEFVSSCSLESREDRP